MSDHLPPSFTDTNTDEERNITPDRPVLRSSNMSLGGSSETLAFFADAQLDLEEAHDIADTPEAIRPQFDHDQIMRHSPLQLPRLKVLEDGVDTTRNVLSSSLHNTVEKDDFSRITNNDSNINNSNTFEITQLVVKKRKPRWPRDLPWTIAFLATVPTTLLIASSTTTTNTSTKVTIPLHPLIIAALGSLFLVHWTYRSPPGPEGDDLRLHRVVILGWAAPLAAMVLYAALAVVMLRRHHTGMVLVALAAMVREIYAMRRWHQQIQHGVSSSSSTSSSYASRMQTFHAVASTALDILTRGSRRNTAVITALVVLQIGVVALVWRHALQRRVLVVAVVGAGKWATAVVTRCLTYWSTASVLYWCAAAQQLQQQQQQQQNGGADNEDTAAYDDDEDDLPEAYRTVDASVYQSVFTNEETMRFMDDDDDDDGQDLQREVLQEQMTMTGTSITTTTTEQRHSIRSILWTALSLSFGSIAACAAVGGMAQFAWSQIRRWPLQQQQQQQQQQQFLLLRWIRTHLVHRYNDLAMAHVVLSYKGYVRSARDVAAIMESSGMEPVLHEDITTHICNSLGGAITSALVLVTTSKSRSEMDTVLLLLLCYTLVQSVMEPLRAAVKAVYVAFAHNPHCLQHAYPLLYHRLNRMAGSGGGGGSGSAR